MDMVLALDIGGTSVKNGLVSKEGEILYRNEYAVGDEPLLLAVRNAARLQTENAQKQRIRLQGIAVAATGQIDGDNGVIAGTNGAIPGWEGVNLKKELGKEIGFERILVENDANCAAYIEAVKGVGREKDSVLLVTLGTGIGSGIVYHKKLIRGAHGLAGEAGHICIEYKGRPCPCGRYGCWERYASVSALVRDAADAVRGSGEIPQNGKDVFAMERSGNRLIHGVVERYFEFLCLGLADLIHCLNPEIVILGGGISSEGKGLCDRVMLRLKEMVMPGFLKDLVIRTAKYQNDAGMLGAAELFFHSESSE